MKKLILTFGLLLSAAAIFNTSAQDYPKEYLGLPGDNLNLYAVMDLFRDSPTLESFERDLNDPEKMINNLDLNGDNYVDYIMIKDYVDGNVHNIVLYVALSPKEIQDVAVFIVEKMKNGSAYVQLIGDVALYGKDYIIEPNYNETPNPAYKGNVAYKAPAKVVTTTHYEVAAWPIVTYVYVPTYKVYYSPWYWGYYPTYWVRWRPHYYHYYYGYHYNLHPHYYGYYRPYPHYRYPRYQTYYYSSIRHHSPTVRGYIQSGYYKTTYSRPDEMSRGVNYYQTTRGVEVKSSSTNTTTGSPNSTSKREGVSTKSSTSTIRDAQPQQREMQSVRSTQSATKSTSTTRQSSATPSQPSKSTTPQKAVTPAAPAKSTPSTSTKSATRATPSQTQAKPASVKQSPTNTPSSSAPTRQSTQTSTTVRSQQPASTPKNTSVKSSGSTSTTRSQPAGTQTRSSSTREKR